MKKLEFSIVINANPEKVWQIIIGKDSYGKWTAPFAAGSSVETDWKKGSKALFHDGTGNGMVSEIVESIPGKFLSIHHLGEVKDGVEDPTTYKGEEWGDALENYTLKEVGDTTVWLVNMDMNDQYVSYMEDTWPLAMAKVKEMAEET
ncbi:SRPBCC family protein [Sphingobacterium faecium]|uniref:SRPBCC family protein n=1 Tax=Sphingobacterium faecium TaxID=34087 RepID=UPI002469888D|nr:SRPBCC domain-containing protein [Sphingobacterium faecium]MDH5826227.1 SRPBCC domain-containing protein [Sphingobacterium faecium]